MSYPAYGGGYPPQQPAPGAYGSSPGYPQAGGYPPPGGMPTAESASAAAYGQGGGMPYAPQPGGAPGLGFGGQPGYPAQQGYPPQGGGYPAPGGYGAPAYGAGGVGGPAPGYGAPQPGGYGAPPAAGYGAPQAGGYGAPQAGGYGAPQAGGYGAPQAAGYGAPQAGGYGAPQAGGYGAPQAGGYGAPSAGGYGAPPTSQPGYGAPQGQHGHGAPASGYGAPQGGQYGAPGSGSSNPGQFKIYEEGTLRPHPNFNSEQDVQVLRKAMKGLGTDEKAIIDVLGHRSSDQRQQIKLMYKTCFGRDLINDLKSELGGNFEDACVVLLMKSDELDAYELRRAMRGAGTDEAALIEILCTRSNAQIHALNAAYKLKYGKKLEDDIINETSGHFRKLLVSMSVGGRQENQPVDINKAKTDAQRLHQAGERRWGTDENVFNMILASQSYEQCRAVFAEYSQIAKHDIEQAIRNEMSGDLSSGMVTIVRMIRSKHGYFADRLYQSMKGMGTDDRTLVRIIVTRSEVDMKQIKIEFQKLFGKTLESFIRDDISGDYRKLMLALVTDH